MFEQSILVARKTNKTWALAASLVVEASLIAVGIIIPLVYTDRIPGLAKWVTGVVAPPPAAVPKPPPVVEAHTATSQRPTVSSDHVFRLPPRIPTNVDTRPDPVLLASDSPQPYIVGAFDGPPSMDQSALAQMLRQPLPKPRPPDKSLAHEAPVQKAPVHVSKGVQDAKIINKVIPVYPVLAIAAHVQGTVHLLGVIGRDGTIRELRVLDGSPLLVHAALDAVRQWTYRPTLLSGEPVEVVAPIEVNFTLNH